MTAKICVQISVVSVWSTHLIFTCFGLVGPFSCKLNRLIDSLYANYVCMDHGS